MGSVAAIAWSHKATAAETLPSAKWDRPRILLEKSPADKQEIVASRWYQLARFAWRLRRERACERWGWGSR